MQPQRRQFLKTLSAGAAAMASSAEGAAPQADGKPNILIVMSDQHRYGLTRGTGFALDTMPALDRFAASGISFGRAYTTAPLCVPARISMLTGRWPHAHRVRQNSAGRFAYFDQDLFQVAKQQGYRTGLAGKNHSHLRKDRVDFFHDYGHSEGWTRPGDDKAIEFDQWLRHINHSVWQEPAPFPAELQHPYRIVSDAIDFMQSSGGQRFALWVSFPEPHNPYQVPKPYFDMFPPEAIPARDVGPEVLKAKGFKWEWLEKLENRAYPGYNEYWRRTRSNYCGMLRLIDDQIARLFEHVPKNTIVVYLADHGDYFCDYGLMRKGAGTPEVLTRIPMIWSGPGVKAQANHPAFVSTADVMPTLCEIMGAPIPHGVQGRSIWPLLQGSDYPEAEFESICSEVGFGGLNYGPGDTIDPNWGIMHPPGTILGFDELNPVTQSGTMKMVRQGDWKLTADMMGNFELYNVAKDYYELHNLYRDPSSKEIRDRMMETLVRWTLRTQDDLPVAAYPPKWAKRNWYAAYRE
jgi:arylsulfatase A-like enzyme